MPKVLKLMATSQDNMFQESLVKFSYDREKEIIKGAKNPKSSPVVKNIHPNKFFETTNFNYSEKKTLSESEYTRFEDKFIFMAKQFLSY